MSAPLAAAAADPAAALDRPQLTLVEGGDRQTGPFRPAQFLGAKSRVLDALMAASEPIIPRGGRVLDAFTGSSLVAQAFAHRGRLVLATDALRHCVVFARALLAVDADGDLSLPDALETSRPEAWESAWQSWLDHEDAAVAQRDPDTLIALTQSLPQIWRPTGASPAVEDLFRLLRPGASAPAGIISALYAGTYFSLRQAIEIDRIRSGISRAAAKGRLTRWQHALLLAGLLSAASECAFSAGKHYAQPHRIRAGKDLTFIRGRIVADRSKVIEQLYRERVAAIVAAASSAGEGHAAEHIELERLVADAWTRGGLDAVYADPPYTAQQYSRFYHVPEVISTYRVPGLQTVRGRVTRGLYPVDRFKSRFCSRRQAPAALRDLARLARERASTLLLSYSASRSGTTGNQRSLDLDDVRSVLHAVYGRRVREIELDLRYRQFNANDRAVVERDDVELLFVAGTGA